MSSNTAIQKIGTSFFFFFFLEFYLIKFSVDRHVLNTQNYFDFMYFFPSVLCILFFKFVSGKIRKSTVKHYKLKKTKGILPQIQTGNLMKLILKSKWSFPAYEITILLKHLSQRCYYIFKDDVRRITIY